MHLLLCLHCCFIYISYVLTHYYIIVVNSSFALNIVYA